MERKITEKTCGMSLQGGGKDNPWTVVAACIYMASHLVGYPKTLEGNGNRVRRTFASWISSYHGGFTGTGNRRRPGKRDHERLVISI